MFTIWRFPPQATSISSIPTRPPGQKSKAPCCIYSNKSPNHCHPERSDCFAKRTNHEVEGPLQFHCVHRSLGCPVLTRTLCKRAGHYAQFLNTSAEFFDPNAMQLHTACSTVF